MSTSITQPKAPPTAQLAAFAAGLTFDAIPESAVRKTEDLLVDWFGSALAGKSARPVETIARFAAAMGPQRAAVGALPAGSSEVLIHRSATSPYLAAMVNAAASHVAEQDRKVQQDTSKTEVDSLTHHLRELTSTKTQAFTT